MKTEPVRGGALQEPLLADHDLVERQLGQIVLALRAGDLEQIPALWTAIDARLKAHLEIEDRLLLPALLRWRRRDARAIIEEHKHIRARMAEMGAILDGRPVKADAVRTFLDELHAHARTKEKLLYQWADEHLSESEKADVLSALR